MNSCFHSIYLILGLLMDMANLLELQIFIERDPNTTLETNYYVAYAFIALNAVLYVMTFVMGIMAHSGLSDSLRKIISIFLYIFAAIFTIADLVLGVWFEQTISRIFKAKNVNLYFLYSGCYVGLCLCRALITAAFCLFTAREVAEPDTSSRKVHAYPYQQIYNQEAMMLRAYQP